MRTRLLGSVAGMALAAALVAGCGPAPGAAASVDGDVIGQDEVAAVVADLEHYGVAATPSQALASLITATTLVEVAAEAGYGVSDQDAMTALSGVAEQAGVDEIEVGEATVLVVRRILATEALQSDADAASLLAQYEERVAELDVTISPRYGTWDPAAAVVPSTYDWIVAPSTDAA